MSEFELLSLLLVFVACGIAWAHGYRYGVMAVEHDNEKQARGNG